MFRDWCSGVTARSTVRFTEILIANFSPGYLTSSMRVHTWSIAFIFVVYSLTLTSTSTLNLMAQEVGSKPIVWTLMLADKLTGFRLPGFVSTFQVSDQDACHPFSEEHWPRAFYNNYLDLDNDIDLVTKRDLLLRFTDSIFDLRGTKYNSNGLVPSVMNRCFECVNIS